jgi:hypothetical protein
VDRSPRIVTSRDARAPMGSVDEPLRPCLHKSLSEQRQPGAVNRAPPRGGRRSMTMLSRLVAYGAAGLAIGLASAALGAGLASPEADASGADGAVSSDLLQAAPRNIATSARSRTLRIVSSLDFPQFT